MSAYEGLVERAAKAYADSVEKTLGARVPANGARREAIEAVLAEVIRTLETVTPEMLLQRQFATDDPTGEITRQTFIDMLRASPLSPPKVKP